MEAGHVLNPPKHGESRVPQAILFGGLTSAPTAAGTGVIEVTEKVDLGNTIKGDEERRSPYYTTKNG